MDKQTQKQFERALEHKQQDARERSEQHAHDAPGPGSAPGDQSVNVQDPRGKSSQHGKVTADKWNQ